jgi:FkbM family methyltransferase
MGLPGERMRLNFLVPIRGILAHPLGRRRPLFSLWRFLRWQLISRLRESVVVPFVNQSHLQVSRGMTGLTGNIYCGLHEFESMGFLLHLLRPDDLFVDVGANAGSYTVLAGKAIGSRVLAVEPSATALAALQRNIECNDLASRVEVRAVVAAEAAGTLSFTLNQDTMNHVALPSDVDVPIRGLPADTLDSLLSARAATLIKIDVEGFELNVLRGAPIALRAPELLAVIVEINGSDDRFFLRPSDLVQLLEQAGFLCCNYDPIQRALHEVDPLEIDGNAIFVRNRPEIERRLTQAPGFVVPGWAKTI